MRPQCIHRSIISVPKNALNIVLLCPKTDEMKVEAKVLKEMISKEVQWGNCTRDGTEKQEKRKEPKTTHCDTKQEQAAR